MREPEARTLSRLTPEEYLEHERTARGRLRHEFVAGDVFAMSPESRRHSVIALNIAKRLDGHSRGTACQVYQNVCTWVSAERYYYPDHVVTCDASDRDEQVVRVPCFVVEITSPSTRSTDLREKVPAYKASPSVQGILIVEQKRRRVLSHRRRSAGDWEGFELTGVGTVDIPCLDASLSLDEIYEGLDLPRMGVREGENEYTIEEYEQAWMSLALARSVYGEG